MAVSIIPGMLMVALLLQAPQATPPAPVIAPGPADFVLTPKGAAQNWPMFRGPQASGVADAQGALVEWDVKAGKNVRWKTPIPGVANSSPVIWGNRIYVATAISSTGENTFQAGNAGINAHADISEHSWRLYALDAATGAIVWEKEVHKGVPRTKRHPKGSQAAASPVTDGRRVVVLFGTAGILATYDVNGTQLWKKDLGPIDNGYVADPTQQWGHSASPILYENSVIIQADQQKGSYIAAYDLADGKELWKTIREDEISTWGTPLVVKGKAGDELITNGTKIRGLRSEDREDPLDARAELPGRHPNADRRQWIGLCQRRISTRSTDLCDSSRRYRRYLAYRQARLQRQHRLERRSRRPLHFHAASLSWRHLLPEQQRRAQHASTR